MESAARRYKTIRREEFESFLESICDFAEFDAAHYLFDFVEESPGKWRRVDGVIGEYCYYVAVNLDRGTCLKIYSSIERDDCVSRESGEDAIRVVAANAHTGEPVRPAFPKVKRIKKWRRNLHRRMSEAISSLGIAVDCPTCQGTLVLRKRKEDGQVFLGCLKFPDCKGSRNL